MAGSRARALAVPGLAVLLALVQLGPALGPGVVLSYDLSFVPGGGFTPFTAGAGVVAPRAVPSDAVVAAVALVLPVGLVQKLLLLAVLVGVGTGCARLLAHLLRAGPREVTDGAVLVAELVCVVAAQWNPFVTERLVLGQWTVLLGLAVLPWGLRSALRAARHGVLPVAGWLALASLGGANTVLLVAPPVLVAAASAVRAAPRSAGRLALLVALVVGGCLPWALPALAAPTLAAGDASTTAFVARPDSPAGLVATLLAGGGVWNVGVVPSGRSLLLVGLVSAVVALVVSVVGGRRLAGSPGGSLVLGTGVLALVLVALQAWSVTRPAVAGLIAAVPGGGLLRDGQKLLAWWVTALACSSGATAVAVLDSTMRPVRTAAVVLLAFVPVALLPAAAWGAAGRLEAVRVPDGYEELREVVAQEAPGPVGSLPWGQYRRYPWNGDRVSLDVLPRLLDRRVVHDDSLPLRAGRVAGEDPVSAAVAADLRAGTGPFEALAHAGVGLVVVDLGSGADLLTDEEDATRVEVVLRTDDVALVRVPVPVGTPSPPDRVSTAGVVGWVGGVLTWVLVALAYGVAMIRRRRPAGRPGFASTGG